MIANGGDYPLFFLPSQLGFPKHIHQNPPQLMGAGKKNIFSLILYPGLPNELLLYWHQYPWPFGSIFCSLRSFLSERWVFPFPSKTTFYHSASYASVLTIVSFSVERYLVICFPLYPLPLSDLTRVTLVSALCWVVAMLASIPHLLFTKYSSHCLHLSSLFIMILLISYFY